jgi:hypothetical protein
VNKANVRVLGAGPNVSAIRGPIGGSGTTVFISASNVEVAGFTITRLGNNTADWNNPALNAAGIAIQGTVPGAVIHDNIITGNRTGVDINNSGGHMVRNNVIDFNRTGMIFRNQTDFITVTENFITNNWTVGVLFLDASGGTNSPLQQALHSHFNNNNISANWYGQVCDRQSGGSLPAPGTTNVKDFRNNWWGTPAPVVTTANSTEPGYAVQIPVAYGGTATPPGGQPDINGPASANIQYLPTLAVGTDTNVETTPGRGTFGFQGTPAIVVVNNNNLNGWFFFDDNPGTGTGSGSFVTGSGTPPLGTGSARLQVDSLGRYALGTEAYGGTRMDDITELQYYSYQNNNPGADLAISFQFDIDYDLNDMTTGYAGRLVFEPYIGRPAGTVQQNVWQNWDPRNGVWYGSRTSVTVNDIAGVNQPCQMATPCTWAQVLANFPNAGVRNVAGGNRVLFKAGGPWTGGFDGNVDAFKIRTNTGGVTYDFEGLTPSIQFSSATYKDDESQTATITIKRTIDVTGTSTVLFSTSNGTATGGATGSCGTTGVDFEQVTNQLVTFNPTEDTKTVTVKLCSDLTNEATDETINLTLTSPTGGAVGTPAAAVLSINDTASVYRNTTSIDILLGQAASTYPSQINVTGAPPTIGYMRVTLFDVSHPIPDNIDVLLVGPNGAKYVLMGDVGGPLSIDPAAPVTLTFNDYATAALPDAGPLVTGQFVPTTCETPVSNFPGSAPAGPYNEPGCTVARPFAKSMLGSFGLSNPNGLWSLYIRDDNGAITPIERSASTVIGQVAGGWGLEFAAPTAGEVSLSGAVVTTDGRGVTNARISVTGGDLTTPKTAITGRRGSYVIDGLTAGETYVVTVASRRFTFTEPSRVITLTDSLTGINFVASGGGER